MMMGVDIIVKMNDNMVVNLETTTQGEGKTMITKTEKEIAVIIQVMMKVGNIKIGGGNKEKHYCKHFDHTLSNQN